MIHNYIVTQRVGEQNAGLIPELLDLMLVEEELLQAQRMIQRLLNGEPLDDEEEQDGGDAKQGSSKPEVVLSEVVEALQLAHEDEDSAIQGGFTAFAQRQRLQHAQAVKKASESAKHRKGNGGTLGVSGASTTTQKVRTSQFSSAKSAQLSPTKLDLAQPGSSVAQHF